MPGTVCVHTHIWTKCTVRVWALGVELGAVEGPWKGPGPNSLDACCHFECRLRFQSCALMRSFTSRCDNPGIFGHRRAREHVAIMPLLPLFTSRKTQQHLCCSLLCVALVYIEKDSAAFMLFSSLCCPCLHLERLSSIYVVLFFVLPLFTSRKTHQHLCCSLLCVALVYI